MVEITTRRQETVEVGSCRHVYLSLNLAQLNSTAMSLLPTTDHHQPKATDEVASFVDLNTATFPAETRHRFHETGLFTGVATRSVKEIVDVTIDHQTTIKWHLMNFVVLIHAWLDLFQALEPAWQSAGDHDDSDVSRASIRTFRSFKGDSNITVRICWPVCAQWETPRST